MNPVKRLLAAVRRGVLAWMIAGCVVWTFLLTPYAIGAYQCKDEFAQGESLQCLKPIAAALRKDSNVATYATATVAALIALQLSTRNRKTNDDTN